MFKKEEGSITIMAFVIMLFVSLYGAIILGNSSRKYQLQTNNIETIIASYRYQGMNASSGDKELTQQELERIYENVGGTRISLTNN